MERLLELGADAGACDKRRVSGLHYACGQGRLEVVRFLWSRGAELDAEDPGTSLSPGNPPWRCIRLGELCSCYFAHICLKLVCAALPGGRTPVHWAVLGARPGVLRFLLEKRAWAEGADGADNTPLHMAARRVNSGTWQFT